MGKNSEVTFEFHSKNIQGTTEELHLLKMSAEERLAYDEGLEKGVEQGKIETAATMLRMGLLTVDQVAEATGLSMEKIEELALKSCRAHSMRRFLCGSARLVQHSLGRRV